MRRNVGDVDRMARALLGVFFSAMPFILDYSEGAYLYPIAAVSVVMGGMLLFSAAVGFCYLYQRMGVSTC